MLFAWLSWARVVKYAFRLWCNYRHSYSISGCMSLDPAAGTSFWFRFQILKGVLLSPKLCELSMGILCLECRLFHKKGTCFWSLKFGPGVSGCPGCRLSLPGFSRDVLFLWYLSWGCVSASGFFQCVLWPLCPLPFKRLAILCRRDSWMS